MSATTVAQQPPPGSGPVDADLPPGGTLTRVVVGGNVLTETLYDPAEIVRIIVRYDMPSLADVAERTSGPASRLNLSAAAAAIEAQSDRLRSDLALITASARRSGNAVADLEATLSRTFSGAVLRVNRWVALDVARLPYVRAVTYDETVQVERPQAGGPGAVPARGAGATGAGATVAVLDTGIDYTRDDMGGGFGPGHKVIGGRDLVNGDADPADDQGHGTAVAGVIAADGPDYSGVAPGASLLAVKVCDGRGSCRLSSILQGIEYAVDPDRDPSTDDGADVLNLSLGTPLGAAGDPVAVALDGAAALGALPVVAAGNEGELFRYHGVGQLASSRSALTIGASTAGGAVASFSSRGPTRHEFAIKPEAVALGVSVRAPALGGGYGSYSGTSLSAPLVSGAAAVVAAERPGASADVVKSTLVQSAADLGLDVWTQGLGRVDLEAALGRTVAATPATLALGVADLNAPVWSATRTITLHNVGSEAATYTFALDAPVGVEATLPTGAVTVGPDGTATLEVVFRVDTGVLPNTPINDPEWLPYQGSIVATAGSGDRIAVPFSFVQSPTLHVEVDGIGGDVYVHNRDDLVQTDFGSPTFVLPEGTYDVVVVPSEGYAVLENVVVKGAETVRLSAVDVDVDVAFDLRDETGAAVPGVDQQAVHLYHEPSQIGFSRLYSRNGAAPATIPTSSVEGPYRLDWEAFTLLGTRTAYNFKGSVTTFDDDQTVRTGSQDLAGIDIVYQLPPDAEGTPAIWPVSVLPLELIGFRIAGQRDPVLRPPFEQRQYVSHTPDDGYWEWAYTSSFQTIFAPPAPPATGLRGTPHLAMAPSWEIHSDGTMAAYSWLDKTGPLLTVPAREITYGLGPTLWTARFDNPDATDGGGVRVRAGGEVSYRDFGYEPAGVEAQSFPFFAYQFQDTPFRPRRRLTLRDAGGAVVAEGPYNEFLGRIPSNGPGPRQETVFLGDLAPGPYTLTARDRSYAVRGLPGVSTVEATMDLALADNDPPALRSFTVTLNDVPTDRLSASDAGEIRVGALETDRPLEIQLRSSGGDWIDLPSTREGGVDRASLAAGLAPGYYDVRVEAADAAGNTLEYRAEPAFVKGGAGADAAPGTAPALASPSDREGGLSWPVTLAWTSTGETLGYRVTASTTPTFESVVADTAVVSTAIELDLPVDGEVFWRVRPANAYGPGPWSQVRSFTAAQPVSTDDSAVAFEVGQPGPNPGPGPVSVTVSLPVATVVRADVFDVIGRRVATLVDEALPAGLHNVTWDASDVSSGGYVIRVRAGENVATRRMIVAR